MLYTITWGDFCSTMLPLLIIYYLFVTLKYYRHELIAVFSGRTEPRKGQVVQAAAVAPVPAAGGTITENAPAQPGLFDGQGGAVAGIDSPQGPEERGTPEMFKVMEKVVAMLKGVVAQGVEGGIGREELLMQISDVLSRYPHLKGTPYQGAINSFLVRTCSSHFSLVLEDGDLGALWG